MTTDTRNSIQLWVGGLTFFGLFWAALHFDVFESVPTAWDKWLWPLLSVVGAINLVQFAWGLWKRRRNKSNIPNRS